MLACNILVQLQMLVVIFTHADRQSVDMSITVCLFVNLSLCTVTDFSAGDKASGVKFCKMVHGRSGHGISHFGNFAPQKPKIRRIGAQRQVLPIDASPLLTARSPSVEGTGVYRQYLPSACVDIRP